MPEHPKHAPSGVTDTAADNAHEFIEGAEEQEHKVDRALPIAKLHYSNALHMAATKAHPEAQLDRGVHQEIVESGSKGLGATDNGNGHSKSKIDSIKKALHLKKDDK
ncbi:uncharacterized protein PpBr36_10310 [Pyricularia pennisetigena]|uniref:uncharacterized protein n=1 Tax=Pyricularia pennisetigena TaxID=1578925 RepID=UPI00114EA552|nr:uncharacterized protein PpBr36_10310 [Pyricularia pennisetigena]TLS21452.1 hypothetical protein PpBr36_10310 [Pyricularia pennisetigena]